MMNILTSLLKQWFTDKNTSQDKKSSKTRSITPKVKQASEMALNAAARSIEAYVVYRLNKKEQRKEANQLSIKQFIKKKTAVQIKASPVFLEEDQAINYLKYIDASECLIKVSIPESAIVGKYGELEITADRLEYCQVQDCISAIAV